MIRLVFAILVLIALFSSRSAASAAQPTSCTVEPRTEAEVNALLAAATPAASPTQVVAIDMPAGEQVDETTMAAIYDTLAQITICGESGELYRLLALYSDNYVATVAMAPEPIEIVEGSATPSGATMPPGTPPASPEAGTIPVIEQAVLLADERVAALVTSRTRGQEIDFFVYEADRWRLDATSPYAAPGTPTVSDLAVKAAVAQAAADAGVTPDAVTVVEVRAENFPDAALGCPEPGGVYAQVLTPGYVVVMTIAGQQVEYHTDADGRSVMRCS